MSYRKAMKFRRKHPKGTRQPVIMHTDSGPWPSGAFLREHYWPYLEECRQAGVEPASYEQFYKQHLSK